MSEAIINPGPDGADGTTVASESDQLRSQNASLHAELMDRSDDVAADERAAAIFGSVEELYLAYESDGEATPLATLRQVNWGLRTVVALIDDEEPPALFKIQEVDRWGYTKTLIAAGSFGLIVALLLYELIIRAG